ncbi:MAG TPA: guanylate kinase [Acidimicrobiia bacterium]|nr:guanylate kinase [Acidimicrobiia bacterium]HIL06531.1 guanylate kinase [Acidimicrobiia bacterium]
MSASCEGAAAVTQNSDPIVFVVCGAGGVGKGTIVAELVSRDDSLHLSRSWTTRAQRSGEADGAYVYVTQEQFEARIAENGFYEWADFFDHRYGTPTLSVPEGSDLLLEIDIQGAVAVREREPDAVVVLILPPNRSEQESRMRMRGDDEQDVAQRLATSDAEEAAGRQLADLVVLNDDFAVAVDAVESFIDEARQQHSRS